MSERERLLQAIGTLPDADLVGLSDAAIVRVLAYIKTEAQRPAHAGEPFGHLTPEQEAAADAAMAELISISQETGGYHQDYSEFLARFK
jgi:hypothetical protein